MSTTRIRVSAAVLSAAVALVMTYQATTAAFSDQTDEGGNLFAAGTVVISDNDALGITFDGASLLKPGDTQIGCVEVTYSGSLAADVRLFGAAAGGTGLEAYLDLDVARGTGTCASFGTATTVWSNGVDGDLGAFLASATDFGTGADTWAPAGGSNATVPYRFTVTLQDDNDAQGLTADVTFTWEARNS